MSKKKQITLLFFLFLFSSYCAVTIGQSWDERFHFLQGKITFDYLFSFGRLDKDIFYRGNLFVSNFVKKKILKME